MYSALLLSFALPLCLSLAAPSAPSLPLGHPPWLDDHGHNQPYYPNPLNPVPGKLPLNIDEKVNYYEPHHNNDGNGTYKRSPCPAVNLLANRGYIPRDGKQVSYPELAQASRDVYNFGDDNIMLVLVPAFSAHPNATHLDLDQFADAAVQHLINCPAAPTRMDIEIGDNIDLNMTLLESLLSFSKEGVTLSLEDMAEHHHLRHNESKAENPRFRFGNIDAACALAQYANLAAVLGRVGPHGLSTVYVDDVREFYEKEDLPSTYGRRELPYFSVEANDHIDRMAYHVGFQIVRPFPKGDGTGKWKDVEPVVARYEGEGGEGGGAQKLSDTDVLSPE
ncbi:hypothetical protein MMC21_006004 [Puttea exsequens]|nr:hypothetical protein [Puttea exsequens]